MTSQVHCWFAEEMQLPFPGTAPEERCSAKGIARLARWDKIHATLCLLRCLKFFLSINRIPSASGADVSAHSS
jgi:hypothetical protein